MNSRAISWNQLGELAKTYGSNFLKPHQHPVNLWIGRMKQGELKLADSPTKIGLVVLGLDPAGEEPINSILPSNEHYLRALGERLANRSLPIFENRGDGCHPFWMGTRLLLQNIPLASKSDILFLNIFPFVNNRAKNHQKITINFLNTNAGDVPTLILGVKTQNFIEKHLTATLRTSVHPSARNGQFYKSLLCPPNWESQPISIGN